MTKKELKKLIFNIGTILEIVTVFIYAIFRKDIIIFIGFPIAVILMLLGKVHKKTVQEKKLEQIELHDERNIIITDKAQSIAVIIDSVMARYFTYYYNKRL